MQESQYLKAPIGQPSQTDLLVSLLDNPSKKSIVSELLSLKKLPETFQLKVLQSLALSLSKSNYDSFTSFVRRSLNQNYNYDLTLERSKLSEPMDCFDFSLMMQRLLSDVGYGDVEIYGTKYDNSDESVTTDHTALVCELQDGFFYLDPFNNLDDVYKIETGITFCDKTGKTYKVSFFDPTTKLFNLTYTSSKGIIKTLPYKPVSNKQVESSFENMISKNKWRVLYSSYQSGISDWISYDPIQVTFSSNIREFNNMKLADVNSDFLNKLNLVFNDKTLIKNILQIFNLQNKK